jgi:hypothetical protein
MAPPPPPGERQTGALLAMYRVIRGPATTIHHGRANQGLAPFLLSTGAHQGAIERHTGQGQGECFY